jgi:small subunit ribosomal protein S18
MLSLGARRTRTLRTVSVATASCGLRVLAASRGVCSLVRCVATTSSSISSMHTESPTTVATIRETQCSAATSTLTATATAPARMPFSVSMSMPARMAVWHRSLSSSASSGTSDDGKNSSTTSSSSQDELSESQKQEFQQEFDESLETLEAELEQEQSKMQAIADEAGDIESSRAQFVHMAGEQAVREFDQLNAMGEIPQRVNPAADDVEYDPELYEEVDRLIESADSENRIIMPEELANLKGEQLSKQKPGRYKKNCKFCRPPEDSTLNYADVNHMNLELMHEFMNERGMIIARRFTGTCMKHQRRIARVIKRARNMGLISHHSNWKATDPDA